MAKRSDELSPYWSLDVASGPEGQVVYLRERYPGAANDDPVGLHFTLRAPTTPPEEAAYELLWRTLDYGGAASIAPESISQVEITASPETEALLRSGPLPGSSGQVVVASVDETLDLPTVLDLRRLNGDEVAQSVRITCRTKQQGLIGATLIGTDDSGILTVRLTAALEGEPAPPVVELNYSAAAGHHPYAVLPALELIADAEPNHRLEIRLGPAHIGTTGPVSALAAGMEYLKPLAAYVRALARLAEHAEQIVTIPAGPSEVEIQEAIAMAEAVDGGNGRTPYRQVHVAVAPGQGPELARIWANDGALIMITDMDLTHGEQTLPMGRIMSWCRHTRLVNAQEMSHADPDAALTATFEAIGEQPYFQWSLPPEE